MVTSSLVDEFDIRESFEALDDEKFGRLTMDQFYTLYLGLGYPQLTKPDLRGKVHAIQSEESVTIEVVLYILSQVRTVSTVILLCMRNIIPYLLLGIS
jgi:hypothetical protein